MHIFLTKIHVYFPTDGKEPVGPMRVDHIYIYIERERERKRERER